MILIVAGKLWYENSSKGKRNIINTKKKLWTSSTGNYTVNVELLMEMLGLTIVCKFTGISRECDKSNERI